MCKPSDLCAQDLGSECSPRLWPAPCSLMEPPWQRCSEEQPVVSQTPVTAGGGRVWSPRTKRFPESGVLPPREWSLGARILSRQIFMILKPMLEPADHLCVTYPALWGPALLRPLTAKVQWSWPRVLIGVFPIQISLLHWVWRDFCFFSNFKF